MAIIYWDTAPVGGVDVDFGEGPLYSDNPWDFVQLGNLTTPGISVVRCQPQRELDKKKRHGSDGAKLTLYGYLPSEVMITVEVWTGAQWKAWQEIARAIWPKAGKPAPDPFDIRHPETDLWGIKSVQVVSPSSSTKGQVPQSRIWTIKCIEYFPPSVKSTTHTAAGSKVKITPEFQPPKDEKNALGPPPSVTSTGPLGAPKKPAGGVS